MLNRLHQRMQATIIDINDDIDFDAVRLWMSHLGALKIEHTRSRKLMRHLDGTRAVCHAWNQSKTLQAAALCHSLYSTESFHKALLPIEHRSRLRAKIGSKAEHLVYTFARLDRKQFWRELANHNGSNITKSGSGNYEEQRNLAVLLLANEIEHPHPKRHKSFVPSAQRMRIFEQAFGEAPVPTLCSFTTDRDRVLLSQYTMAITSLVNGDSSSAMTQLELAANAAPFIGECHILQAAIWKMRGADRKADDALATAAYCFSTLGTNWDQCFPLETWVALATSQTQLDSPKLFRSLLDESHMQRHPVDRTALPERFVRYLEHISTAPAKAKLFYPSLPAQAFFNPTDFEISSLLVSHFDQIKHELDKLQPAMFQREAEKIARDGEWDVLFLFERGRKHDLVCASLPTLSRILDSPSVCKTMAGLVYVSRLGPHSRIAPHRGPTNLRVRCHLGLAVPAGDCKLSVDGQVRSWSEGECVIFDDSLTHEVWNNTSEERIVLIVDLWHPELSLTERERLQSIHSFIDEQALALHQYWKMNEGVKNQTKREGYH